jgi:hypothetical protein
VSAVFINLFLVLSATITVPLAWSSARRFGLFAAVLGTAALFGTSYGLEWFGPATGARALAEPWTLSWLGASSMWLIVLGWVFVVGSLGGLVRRLWL